MDIGGSQYDVHPPDCTQFTGTSLIQFLVDHHLSLSFCSRFFLLLFALSSPDFTQSHRCGVCGHVLNCYIFLD